MKRRAGFTLIELLITITVMVVLLGLSVVALRSSQATARDEERTTDAEVIARHLEIFYNSGTTPAADPIVPVSTTTTPTARLTSATFGSRLAVADGIDKDGYSELLNRYPSAEVMDSETDIKTTLRDIDPNALRAPNVAPTDPVSLIVAADNQPQTPTENQYIYQPLDKDGALCQDEYTDCRKFNLYYKLETDSAVQKITSRHQ